LRGSSCGGSLDRVPGGGEGLMGDAKRRKAGGEVLHRKQLFDGKITAEELHRKIVYAGHNCGKCGSNKPVMRVMLLAPKAEVVGDASYAARLVKIAAANEGNVPVLKLKYGDFVRMATVYGCGNCKKEIEKWAAHTPSSWIVEFDRSGVDPDKIIVQVPH